MQSDDVDHDPPATRARKAPVEGNQQQGFLEAAVTGYRTAPSAVGQFQPLAFRFIFTLHCLYSFHCFIVEYLVDYQNQYIDYFLKARRVV